MRKEDRDFFEGIVGDFNSGFGEDYNIFACEQGILIAEALRTRDRIVEFNKASCDRQKEMVPLLSSDHSGGTFSMACSLAITYIPMLRENRINEIIN